MAEVLSQSQIDALLNSMRSGESDSMEEPEKKEEKSYRLYDFYSPKKFTKDRLKLLKGVYDNYCRIATSQINSLFRVNSEVEVVTVEEQRYYEFSNALADNDIITLIDIKTGDNTTKYPPLLMHSSPQLMVGLIDRMLGGGGEDIDVDSSYIYTDLEMPLYKKIMEYLVTIIKDCWSSYVKLTARVDRIEENPSMFQDISLDETVVIILLDARVQGGEGKISFCIPENLLSGIFEVIDSRKRTEDEYENALPDVRRVIFNKLKDSVLTVKAALGEAEMDMSDIYSLKVGDVINLNKPQDEDITVFVEEEPWFKGRLGTNNKKIAVKINNRVEGLEPDENVAKADAF